MKTIVILLVGLGVGICASFAQTGLPAVPAMPPPITAPAPAPAITAPLPAATVRPKPSRRSQDAERRNVRRPAVENATPGPRQNRQNSEARRPPPVAAVSYANALKRQHHQRHDRQWWTTRYRIIVLVNGAGYYYWDSGYWFPAYGYDPDYENYDYDGPIYTYGNLLPDQVIYNVQRALKDRGYYSGPLT